jgi:hypothetical protein
MQLAGKVVWCLRSEVQFLNCRFNGSRLDRLGTTIYKFVRLETIRFWCGRQEERSDEISQNQADTLLTFGFPRPP